MDPVKRAALERVEAADEARKSDPKWQAAEEMVAKSQTEMAAFLDGVPDEDRAQTALNAYRDADGNLRSRHGAFRVVSSDDD